MPASLPALALGGDYNPEQWSREVHKEDRALMREAGVDLVTLGVFSWALPAARAGPLGVRLAGRADGRAARRRDPRRPRHGDRLSPALARPPAPGDAAGDPGRRDPVAGRPTGLLPQLAGLPRARPAAVPHDGRAVRRPPGAGTVARVQRDRLPQRALLLRRQRRSVPATGCGRATPTSTGSTRPGGRPSGPSTTATSRRSCRRDRRRPSPTPPSSSTSCGSPPTSCSTTSSSSATCCTRCRRACP